MKKLMEINIYFYLFILIIIFVFFLSLDVNALVDNNTTYEITMPDYSELLDFSCGDYNFRQELDNILQNTDFENLSFDIAVMNRLSATDNTYTNVTDIYFYPKNNVANNFSVYYVNNGALSFSQRNLPFTSSFRVAQIYFESNSCTDLDNNSNWLILKNAIENDTIPTNNNNNYDFPFWYSIGNYSPSVIVNNNYSATYWYYFSSNDLYYNFGNYYNTGESTTYFKKLHLIDNDTYYTINNGSNDGPLPSYTDIYGFSGGGGNLSLIDYQNSLGTLYLNFTPQEISNFDVKLDFDVDNSITSFDYGKNTSYNFSCFGRVNNNNNYYSYEELPCSFEQYNTFDNTQHGQFRFENIEFFDSNDNLITDFSRYDKLFVYVNFNYYNDNIPKSISNFSITTNLKNLYTKHFQGSIYDNFDNLPLLFKMFISSNNKVEYSYFSIKKSNNFTPTDRYFLNIQQYNTSNLNPIGSPKYIGKDVFQDFQVSNVNNLGYMVFQQIDATNDGSSLNNIEMTFNKNIIISINNSSSNNLYYYDDTNTVVNDDIQPNYDTPSSNSYDLSYYFSIINDYIEDASDKVVQFNTLTQDFYDNMPIFLQSTIYVLFILFCTYFLYREIKR